jgi:hypothetical protein
MVGSQVTSFRHNARNQIANMLPGVTNLGVPGPTEPNRCYTVAASSHGMGTNDEVAMVKGLPQKTMFSQVLDMGLDYRLYMKQVPANIMFKVQLLF